MHTSHRLGGHPVAATGAVVEGDTYRFTMLTDGLLRLEYAADGAFVDRPSSFAINRKHPVPDYKVLDQDEHLEITTDRVHLTYDKRPFSRNGLSVQVRGNVSSYHSLWRFGQQPDDLGGTARTLDEADGAIPLEPGVVSRAGYGVIDDSRSLLLTEDGWVTPRDGGKTDLYFFGYGRDYLAALRAFYAVSGATPVLPRFALGNWWSRFYPYSSEAYVALMTRFAAEGIPFSVAVLDMDWHLVDIDPSHGSGWTGYTWNRELFPDPDEFLGWLHAHDLRVTLNIHPADGVRVHEDSYRSMAEALGRDPDSGEPIAFDVTDRAFLEAYFNVLHRGLEDRGVDFWWIDWQSGSDSRVAGVDPLWMLNHFHFLDNARGGRRPLTFSRYAGPGSHRYPVGFSGDTVVSWASLAFQPYFTATASNIGYGWWSHDIGGHMFGVKDDELATRWVQLGVYSPILRLHSSENRFNSKEPWRFGSEAREQMTSALRFRHSLVPYLHTMNWRAAREGVPLVQPMYYRYPDVREAYDVPTQFEFGTELVVAPITDPRSRSLLTARVRAWLPTGVWVDLMTDLVYDGGRMVYLHRDLTSIPVLARAGAVVPLAEGAAARKAAANPDTLEVLVVAGANGRFVLREDDDSGDGTDEDRWARTSLDLDYEAGTFTVGPAQGNTGCIPNRRRWLVTFVAFDGVDQITVEVDGRPAAPVVSWSGDRCTVTVDDVPVSGEVRVGFRTGGIAANDVHTRVFALLDMAQLGFDLKTSVDDVVRAAPSAASAFAQLQALDLDPELLSALSEVLVAQTG
jgi:alpha-glucosidase (family GH31 glycosyl hydrolase)